jgi:hypothetical protein
VYQLLGGVNADSIGSLLSFHSKDFIENRLTETECGIIFENLLNCIINLNLTSEIN